MSDTVTIEALEKRISALEKPAAGANPALTEARVSELVATGVKTFIAGDEGKKLVGAEASRITMEAISAISTNPAKPSPENGNPTATVKTFADLVTASTAAGKTKSQAVIAVMQSNPKEYQEFLKTGGKL